MRILVWLDRWINTPKVLTLLGAPGLGNRVKQRSAAARRAGGW